MHCADNKSFATLKLKSFLDKQRPPYDMKVGTWKYNLARLSHCVVLVMVASDSEIVPGERLNRYTRDSVNVALTSFLQFYIDMSRANVSREYKKCIHLVPVYP